MAKYWFARRFPVSEVQNNRMAPVSSEGWAVVALFAGCMIAGAVGLFLFSFAYRQPFVGIVTMAVFAIAGAATFISLAYIKGDKAHTVDDYRAGRVRS
jgi:hypothetical protein